jgi:hypothetical protein
MPKISDKPHSIDHTLECLSLSSQPDDDYFCLPSLNESQSTLSFQIIDGSNQPVFQYL